MPVFISSRTVRYIFVHSPHPSFISFGQIGYVHFFATDEIKRYVCLYRGYKKANRSLFYFFIHGQRISSFTHPVVYFLLSKLGMFKFRNRQNKMMRLSVSLLQKRQIGNCMVCFFHSRTVRIYLYLSVHSPQRLFPFEQIGHVHVSQLTK